MEWVSFAGVLVVFVGLFCHIRRSLLAYKVVSFAGVLVGVGFFCGCANSVSMSLLPYKEVSFGIQVGLFCTRVMVCVVY